MAVTGSAYAAFRLHREYIGQQTAMAAHTASVQAQKDAQQKLRAEQAQEQLTLSIAKLEAACQRNYDNMTTYAKQHIPDAGCTL